ncbi:fatty acid amide hydrolase isoform X2 [Mercurialis annua]|uniref:fatty acid amide hydrolase isoform X2 n=1 Tax=Mercurialis annua TaxID=3986 RepID=UPI00215E92A0|nr:fatty acid amide hydrolase isoform X2 [Mercurialis annua]XP_050210417.1 fatty acid amide hydrolase isoform X2 [Mercurialis annua]XP_050210418.1 fatty acid amide hydrolase isoform X2 [Mercurialis annua]
MGKKRVMVPADEVDLSTVKYQPQAVKAPHLTGWGFKLFVHLLEAPVIGSLIMSNLKKENKMNEILRETEIPEPPMFKPEYPPQEPEPGVVAVDEDGKPEDRVEIALSCLPHHDFASSWKEGSAPSFRYWKIRDYAHAYRSQLVTPSMVAERIILAIEEFKKTKPTAPLLISFDKEEIRKQATTSTQRFEEGNPISILDGIFMAIKDDIDCYPHPTKGATTWKHEVRLVEKDAVSVSRLRSCGVIFVGKANMHELGMGTTGNNPNYGTTRNPHGTDRYTGGSSSGPAAIVASGLCSAALGTDGGGSVRIPSSLCGVVGLKTTYGRTDMGGSICDSGTVEIIGPIASSVEDVMLVYSVILGSSPANRISLKPSPPCLPNLTSYESTNILGSLRLGKYTAWFNDVQSTEVSDKCEDILNLLLKTHGCEMVEIVVPEFEEMRIAHLVSIGSETQSSLSADIEDGKGVRLAYDTRTSLALFQSFSAADYVTAQCLRRRLMYHHMEIFKKVDVIVTPTTGMTAPKIPPSALKYGETNMQVTGDLMRFILAANLLGFPAITVPVGYDKEGLPIGLQIMGRPWAEATILRLAAAVEELCAKSKKQPASFFDVLNAN